MSEFKDTNINNTGTSIKYGADDMEVIARLFNGVTTGIPPVKIKSQNKWGFWDGIAYFRNQADTFNMTIRGPTTLTSNLDLELPSITQNDKLPSIKLANQFTAQQGFELGYKLKNQTAPSTPSSGFGALYLESDHLKKKDSNGLVIDYDNIAVGIPSSFEDLSINILNPLETSAYSIKTSAITSDVKTILPVLATDDTFMFNNTAATVKNKTLDSTNVISSTTSLPSSVLKNTADNLLGDHYLEFGDISTPSNPASGSVRLFMNSSNGQLSVRKSSGTTVSLESTGSGSSFDILTTAINIHTPTYRIIKDGSTYYAIKYDGTITSNSNLAVVLNGIFAIIPTLDNSVYTKLAFGEGDFILNDPAIIYKQHNIHWQGAGAGLTKIKAGSGIADDENMIDIQGDLGASKSLTANGDLYANTVTVSTTDAATFNVDEWVLLSSGATWSTINPDLVNIFKGEIKKIRSIDTGTGVITFTTDLQDDYLTADSAILRRVDFCNNISFSDMTITMDSGFTAYAGYFFCKFVNQIRLDRVNLVDQLNEFSRGITLASCINGFIEGSYLSQSPTITYDNQYAISIANCCQNINISNCHAQGIWRHPFAIATGYDGGTFSGVNRGITVTGCTALSTRQASFDTHAIGDGIQFINCIAEGTVEGGSAAFNCRSKNTKFIGCIAKSPRTYGFHAHEEANNLEILGCSVLDGWSTGIVLEGENDLRNVRICNTTVSACGDGGIWCDADLVRSNISNNHILENEGTGLEIVGGYDGVISGNVIEFNTGWGIAFGGSGAVTFMTVSHNDIWDNTSGSIQNGVQEGNALWANADHDNVIPDTVDIQLGTGTGTKIGTSTSQKLGFFGKTPVTQRSGISDVDSSTVDTTYGTQESNVITSLRTKLNAVLQVLEDLGFTAVA